ncbi:Biotin/lipoate A/B protein ligase [Puccinia graminis f. sp. tritici]|uniref:Putative lipoate-protein ligase A n=1 Tax=Puccinia graminis f. sp. tritici TaxID=56615 RepID=A0A5B0QWQ1_PUCGR|nr:Biotin/lipoate A/B protein ligase [Puccinia graminis f. sp. tritici]
MAGALRGVCLRSNETIKRWCATLPPSAGLHHPIIWTSSSLDPYLNLSIEEYLFRKVEVHRPILFIYRNRKSVIIGRNQNPWQESNLEELDRQGISLVRRRSGGGTVYHDEGNTNYSVMLPRDQFERQTNARLVAKAVQEMGIDRVTVTDRYDVCVGDRKVSGSAFRITNKRAYHHGTMLISSNLAQLKGALRPTPNIKIVDSKAVGSVRSPVTSLVDSVTQDINHLRFVHNLSLAFSKHYYPALEHQPVSPQIIGESELENNPFVRAGYDELKSWNWIYGQTPQFTRLFEIASDDDDHQSKTIPVEVTYKNGVIVEIKFDELDMPPSIQHKISTLFSLGDSIDF